jgi:nucleotide-binding universal stress UspA family protein
MTRTFTRILVPTDFSEFADAALDYAKTLAATFGASLHLLHVFEDPYATPGAFAGDPYLAFPDDLREAVVAEARRQFEARMTSDEQARFAATTEVLMGPTARTIVDYADARQADLIVIGTHGRTGLAHLLIGSTAERVVRTAPCPVLTVHAMTRRVPAARTIAVPTAVAR